MLGSLSFIVFFFNQKTAYEMRISDWSSDVCSSDLIFLCFDLRAMRGASVAIRSRPRRPLARSLRVRPMRNMVQGETPPPVFRNGGNGPMNCAGRQVATVHRLEFVSRGRSNA